MILVVEGGGEIIPETSKLPALVPKPPPNVNPYGQFEQTVSSHRGV